MGDHIKLLHTGIDPIPLLEQIAANPALLTEFTARQDTPGSPHKETFCIFLRWCESQEVLAAFTDIPAIDYPAYKILTEARPIVDKVLEVVGATELGRVIIPLLKPGCIIPRHTDEGAYADHYERFHVCLQAQRGNTLSVVSQERMFDTFDAEPGELFWFDHKRDHWCVNPTPNFRIHLIVDAVAPKYRQERMAIPVPFIGARDAKPKPSVVN